MELRAVPDFALHPESPAVRFHQVFCDGKPQSGATDLSRPCHVDPVKAFKNSRLVRQRNPYARIGNREDYFRVMGFRANHDLTAGRRVLNRVIEQILQNLGQSPAIARNCRLVCSRHGSPKSSEAERSGSRATPV